MIHDDCRQHPDLGAACGCDVVRAAWLAFTEPLEGGVPFFYLDVRGIVTVAYGNAIFSPADAARLPLMRAGGVPATRDEIVAAYERVLGDPHAANRGHLYAKGLTTIRLTREGMGDLALGKYDSNDRILRARVPDWDEMPACARCALHSLAWACGANAHFPRLFSAVNARDFARAALEIHMNEITPEGIRNAGLVPRNVRNRTLMRNAQRVHDFKLDPDTLDWSHDLAVSEPPTLRAVTNPASEPTLHVDPSEYLQNRDPED